MSPDDERIDLADRTPDQTRPVDLNRQAVAFRQSENRPKRLHCSHGCGNVHPSCKNVALTISAC